MWNGSDHKSNVESGILTDQPEIPGASTSPHGSDSSSRGAAGPSMPRLYNRISFKLARTGVAIAFLLGIVLSSAQVYFDFSDQQTEFEAEIARILKVGEPTATRAVHLLDPELAEEVVQGLMEYRFIINAQINDDTAMVLAQEVQSQNQSSTRWVSRMIMEEIREYTVPLDSGGLVGGAPGNLTVDVDMDEAFSAFYKRSSLLVVAGIILPIILVNLLFVVFYLLLTKPLTRLAESFSRIELDNPDHRRLEIDETHTGDELGMLARAGNDFLENTEHHLYQREQAEQKLKEARDDLERRVEVRTHELRREINERKFAETALQELNTSLEQKVDARTRDLSQAKEFAEYANRTKSQFLANMSHELRTPLNAIIGFSQVMKDQMMGVMENRKYHEYSIDIFDSSNHLLHVISDILDLSKIEAGELILDEEDLDVREVIDTCAVLLDGAITRKNLKLVVDVQRDVCMLRADKTRIRQILINFLSNATKFTSDGGEIYLRVKMDGYGGVLMEVVDTGIGIPEEDISRVLEPFAQVDDIFTRTHEGTGLGLSLSKLLVERHSGVLTLESELGKGTTVGARFPNWRSIGLPEGAQEN